MQTQRTELLIKKIQEMSELDFTKQILMPLFISFGYTVNYHGGPSERGKDLICKKEGEFGAIELTVVQVKKTKPTGVASDSKSFSGIITQLQQAAEENVPLISGNYQKPDKVYFITPFEIGVRELESRFAGLQNLSLKNVRVLDGPIIINYLQKQLPQLADKLCGDEFILKSESLSILSNSDLLSALNYANEKDIADFYCDLDFSVGRITSKLFFSLEFSPKKIQQSVNKNRWEYLRFEINKISEKIGRDIISPSISHVENEFEEKLNIWESHENKEISKRIFKGIEEIDNLLKFTISELGNIVDAVFLLHTPNAIFSDAKVRDLTDEEIVSLNQLRFAKNSISGEYVKWFTNADVEVDSLDKMRGIIISAENYINSLRKEGAVVNAIASSRLNMLFKHVMVLNDLFRNLEIDVAARRPEPTFDFEIDGTVIASVLFDYREWVAQGAEGLTTGLEHREKVRSYFLRCQEIFELVELVMDEKLFADAAGIDTKQEFALTVSGRRIHLPVKDVFATGIHCAVYGEAGAGKSTTLHRYASSSASYDKSDEITLWIPLTRVLHKSEIFDDTDIPAIDKLELAISNFFGNGKSTRENEVIPLLKSKSRVVFIFDGVDEVIKRAPWIISAIQMICSNYNNCQVIVSARSTGSYPELRNFLGLTLLPFSDEQVKNFVSGWFKDNQILGQEVVDHLKTVNSVAEIVRNPLLATVLCVLAENEVPLPSGELAMYEERIKLLLGHYDIHKKTRRLVSHHSLLETTARHIAFQLHKNTIRSASREVLDVFAIAGFESTVPKPSREQIRLAVSELIDPCNILVPMTNEGAFGFGHLRYQEFLCAKEINQNRSIEILPFLTSSWWRPVVVLFCRLGGRVDHIINEVISKEHTVERYYDTLIEIISTRDKVERKYLKDLIEKHRRIDYFDADILELSESYSEYEDVKSLGVSFWKKED